MNANELADLLSEGVVGYKLQFEAADMLRTIPALQAEIEALKMGFANSGTHDSELAETRAMAGRLFLKVQDLEFEQEGYENLTEMLESEKAELTEKNCQQQAEITKLKLEWQYMADLTEKLQDFAIWMTGCGYDFCQHEYFIKCRDELLKGIRNERK